MHISDGVLSAPAMVGGYVVALGMIGITLKKVDMEDMPKIAVITAVFFVASLIHIPLGPTSVHLILNGLVGVVLGMASFISIFIGLTLQCLLFQHGGVTSLGWNACMMGLPALCAHFIFKARRLKISDFLFKTQGGNLALAFIAGFIIVFSSMFCLGAVGITVGNTVSTPLSITKIIGGEKSFRKQAQEGGLESEIIDKVWKTGLVTELSANDGAAVEDYARNASFYRLLFWAGTAAAIVGIIFVVISIKLGEQEDSSWNLLYKFVHKVGHFSSEYIFGFLGGSFAVFGSGFILAVGLALSGKDFIPVAKVALLAHVFIMIIEGIVVGFTATFLMKIKPEILEGKKI